MFSIRIHNKFFFKLLDPEPDPYRMIRIRIIGHKHKHFITFINLVILVLRIRIRMDPALLPGSGSGIIVPDLDPAKNERADK